MTVFCVRCRRRTQRADKRRKEKTNRKITKKKQEATTGVEFSDLLPRCGRMEKSGKGKNPELLGTDGSIVGVGRRVHTCLREQSGLDETAR